MRRHHALLIATLVTCLPAHARAQAEVGGIDLRAFPLTPQGGGLTFPGARPAEAGHLRVGLAPEMGLGLFALQVDDQLQELVSLRIEYAILADWQLTPSLAFGLRLPRVQHQSSDFDALRAAGYAVEDPRAGGFGDFGLTGRWSLPVPRGPVRLALTGELALPMGDADALMGLGTIGVTPALVGEVDAGRWTFAATAGYRWRAESGRFLDLVDDDRLTFGLAARLRLDDWLPRGSRAHAELRMDTPAGSPFDAASAGALPTAAEGLLGLKVALPRDVYVTAGLGRSLLDAPGYGREQLRAFFVLGWEGPLTPKPVPAVAPADRSGSNGTGAGDHHAEAPDERAGSAPSGGNMPAGAHAAPGERAPAGPAETRLLEAPREPGPFFISEPYRYENMPLIPRAIYSTLAIPLNVPWWTAEDWAQFGFFAAVTAGLMLPLEPSPDVRLDDWIERELVPVTPDVWAVPMQIVLWSGLAAGGIGTWAWAEWTDRPYIAQGLSLMVESLAVAQIYHLGLKILIGREGPTDGAGQGEILGPGQALFLYPAGTPSGHSGTLYSLMSAAIAYFQPPVWVQVGLHVTVGGLIAMHVINRRHFLSDSFWGAAMGWYIGQWVVKHHRSPVPGRGDRPPAAVLPFVLEGGGGVAISGRF